MGLLFGRAIPPLMLLLSIFRAEALDFLRLCRIQSPIEAIALDEATGQYVILDYNRTHISNDTGPTSAPTATRRLLRHPDSSVFPALTVDTSRATMQSNNSSSSSTGIQVRECFCGNSGAADVYYCPVDKDTCGIQQQNGRMGCFAQSTQTIFIRNAWPVVVIWIAALILCLLFSRHGRNSRYFCWSRLCDSSVNDRIVDGLLQSASIAAVEVAYRRRAALRQYEADRRSRTPYGLALRTKLFHVGPQQEGTNVDEEFTCSICFNALHEGDRIGALACNHKFHVECLKGWLTRRNVCPLCQTPDVASPRYRETDDVGDFVVLTTAMEATPEPSARLQQSTIINLELPDQTQIGPRDRFRGLVLLRR